MQIFLWQTIHAQAHTRFRCKRNQTKALGLAVGTILKEFNVLKIGYANFVTNIVDVLVCGPLKKKWQTCKYLDTILILCQYYLPKSDCQHTIDDAFLYDFASCCCQYARIRHYFRESLSDQFETQASHCPNARAVPTMEPQLHRRTGQHRH